MNLFVINIDYKHQLSFTVHTCIYIMSVHDQSVETKTKTRLKNSIKKPHSTIDKKNKSNKLLPKIGIEQLEMGFLTHPN